MDFAVKARESVPALPLKRVRDESCSLRTFFPREVVESNLPQDATRNTAAIESTVTGAGMLNRVTNCSVDGVRNLATDGNTAISGGDCIRL